MQQRTKFLIVDDDELMYELITEQILPKSEFEFLKAGGGEEAIKLVKQHRPDLILLDLVMPGLSGNDVMIAIKQQGFTGQIIVSTKRGAEDKAIEAFRLGATDFITKPLRPPELMSVLERALEAVRLRREKDKLVDTIRKTNAALESKVQELTSLTNIGQLLTQLRDPEALFEVVLAAMIDLTHADYATILLKDLKTEAITLHAGKNLTLVMQEKLGEVIKDEIAELVLTSGQALAAAGEGLQRFKISREVRAVVYVPMVTHGKGIGVLTVGNHKKRTEFTQRHADLLRSMADYMAVGLTNARLFTVLDHRTRDTQEAMRVKDKLTDPMKDLQARLAALSQQPLPEELKAQVAAAHQLALNMQQHLNDLSKDTQRSSRGIHRISPPKSP